MFLAVGLVGLLALFVAACGNDDGETRSPFDRRGDSGSQPREGAADDRDNNPPGGAMGRGPAGQWADADCFALGTSMASLVLASFGGSDLDSTLDHWSSLSRDVPAEIRGQFETVAEAFSDFYRKVTDAGWDPNNPQTMSNPRVQSAFAEAGELIGSADVERAFDEIEQFFEQVCPQFN
jgi:hypothetical protein